MLQGVSCLPSNAKDYQGFAFSVALFGFPPITFYLKTYATPAVWLLPKIAHRAIS
jgi:hypothetical protein